MTHVENPLAFWVRRDLFGFGFDFDFFFLGHKELSQVGGDDHLVGEDELDITLI